MDIKDTLRLVRTFMTSFDLIHTLKTASLYPLVSPISHKIGLSSSISALMEESKLKIINVVLDDNEKELISCSEQSRSSWISRAYAEKFLNLQNKFLS